LVSEQPLTISKLLAFLTDPLPDYEKLATRSKQIHDDLTQLNVRSIQHGLAAFFFLFGRSYAFWQQNYHYNTIHEYFYGAYRLAVHWGGDDMKEETPLANLLLAFSRAMISYTRCENAVIANDAILLSTSAEAAKDWAQKGIALCEQMSLVLEDDDGEQVLAAIKFYLTANAYLFRGLRLCAQAHLDDAFSPAELDLVESDYLKQSYFQDLSSELQAHLTFARKYIALRQTDPTEIVIDAPHVYLRAIGFLRNPDVLRRLFEEEFSDDALKANLGDQKRQQLKRDFRLPVSAINKPAIQDIFETALGFDNLEQIELDLSPQGEDASEENGNLTLLVHDREHERRYEAEFVHLTISHLGSISVDFAFNPPETTVSHLRVLETLLAPHMGDIKISWPDLYHASRPDELSAEIDQVTGTNFVEQYLIVKQCIERLPDADALEGYVAQWAQLLDDLAQFYSEQQSAISIELKYDEANGDSQVSETRREARRDLKWWEENYRAQNMLIRAMQDELARWVTAHPDHPICAEVEQDVLAELSTEHFTFTFLRDVAERIFQRFEVYLEKLDPVQRSPDDDRKGKYIWHDPNLGWQSIVSFNKVRKCMRGAQDSDSEPIMDMNGPEVVAHRDYVGLVAGSREARASLDDWRFTVRPAFDNLATIRSHGSDLMVVSDNRTLLAFPDDPHYIIKQYEITAQVTANIRAILLGFNILMQEQLRESETLELTQQEVNDQLHRKIVQERKELELLGARTENVLDIIRSYTISKYADHSELLRAMVKNMHLLDAQNALQHNWDYLNHLRTYLAGSIQEHLAEQEHAIDKRLEEQEKERAKAQQRQQGTFNLLVVILSLISGLGAIDPFGQAIVRTAAAIGVSVNLVTVEFAMFVILVIVVTGIGFRLSFGGRTGRTKPHG